MGKTVKTLVNEDLDSGNYNVDCDAQNLSGGIYFCKMEANGFTGTQKMVLVK